MPDNVEKMDGELLARYIAGNVNDRERSQVADWLEASPEHIRRYRSLRRLHDLMVWHAPPESQSRSLPSRSHKLLFFRAAAVVLLLCLPAIWLFQQRRPASQVDLHTVQVPAGQHIELQLADGTKVWLNARSVLAFPDHFDGHERRVKLNGEGFFDVVSDPERPFVVETGSYDVQALGTEFDVMAYGPDSLFQTFLVSGKVEVIGKDRQSRITLSPHEQVYVQNGQLLKTPLQDHNQLSWREGLLIFENEAFSRMILRLERYFDVTIEVKNKQLLERHYTGKFRISDGLEHILKVLSLNGTFRYRAEDNTKRILIY